MNLLIQHSDHDVSGAGSDPLQREFSLKASLVHHGFPREASGNYRLTFWEYSFMRSLNDLV